MGDSNHKKQKRWLVHQHQIKNLKAENFLTEIMASETEFNEFVSFYGDDHKPSKETELKRKAFENLAEIEIDEKCPVKVLRFDPNLLEIVERPVAKIKDEHEFLGLAEVPEIKFEPSDEDSFAIVPKYHGP